MRQIFVSYVPGDQTFAVRLTGDLRASGAPMWLDVVDAEQGRNWSHSVERALDESEMMIVVCSPGALQAEHVTVEWQAYLEARRPVIPVVIAPCDLPEALRLRRPVDFTRDYRRAFHALTTRLIEHGTRIRRTDPVIWTMGDEVQDFREVQQPPAEAGEPEDQNAISVKRMVSALRDRLRRAGS